jgi:hypothetical protein
MAKTKNGFTPMKGKPSGNGKETHGLKDAFAVNSLDDDNTLAEKYTDDGGDEVAAHLLRHGNRNVNKKESNDTE